jgi:hypothetical protein
MKEVYYIEVTVRVVTKEKQKQRRNEGMDERLKKGCT